MLSLRSRKLALTLFCTLALALALLEPAQAADPLALNRRDHANLNRMIKKRNPGLLDDLNPVNNAGTGTDSTDGTATDSGSAATQSTASAAIDTASAAAASQTTTSSSSSLASSATSSSVLSTDTTSSSVATTTTSTSASTTTTSSTTSSSTTTSSSSTSATSTTAAAQTTAAAASQTTPAAVAAQDNSSAGAITITSHVSVSASASPTSSASAKAATSSSSLSKGAITTLAVIAGCIGGGALIWTIFRKWKLRTSKRFDDRLAPIDWQPPTENDDVPGSNRRASIASSFHSAGHDGLVRAPSGSSAHGYGAYGATNQHAPSLQPLPEHDFTAGPATGYLGPNAGYADLARGPSPGPQMQDLSRGPSFNHGYGAGAYPQQQQAGAYDYNAHY